MDQDIHEIQQDLKEIKGLLTLISQQVAADKEAAAARALREKEDAQTLQHIRSVLDVLD